MTSKLRVIDIFCGCGGISLGFEMAGYEIVAGIDSNRDSIETFKKNFPSAKARSSDLLDFSEQRIAAEYLGEEATVLVGGPPCQGFSPANRWQKDSEDPRNLLFLEFLRFAQVLRPKVVVIENVRGILSRNGGYAASRISELLGELGYKVSSAVLDASNYGVPQRRFRAFFVGIFGDVPEFDFNLRKKRKVTVREAIGDLYHLEDVNERHYPHPATSPFQKLMRKRSKLIANHEVVYPAVQTQRRIAAVPQGGNWQSIPINLLPSNRSNRHSSAFKRLDESDVSVTIDTGNAHSNYFHPLYNRIPTVREAARLQSFPDRFIFTGSRTSQYRQVGNAVPPLLAFAIASAIKEDIVG